MDFTFKKYEELLFALKENGYSFQTFEEFILAPKDKVVVLRHDVDRRPKHSLDLSIAEKKVGAKASYYFRIVPESNDPEVIQSLVLSGHELGYHYEDLSMFKGNYDKAFKNYLKNLTYFREFYPVTTICMHGSPEQNIDNRLIWKKFNYKQDGIIAEPYFDVDYNDVFYITDAGRSWNNKNVSVRDKVVSDYDIKVKSIDSMINLISKKKLPDRLIINTHPHNWSNYGPLWFFILIWQNVKNIIKRIFILLGRK